MRAVLMKTRLWGWWSLLGAAWITACGIDAVPDPTAGPSAKEQATERTGATASAFTVTSAIEAAQAWHDGWYGSTANRGANSYLHDSQGTVAVYWGDSNPTAPGKFTSVADCSFFLNATMKRGYGFTDASLKSWLRPSGTGRPRAMHYYDAIAAGNGFARVVSAGQVSPGHVLAVKYLTASATENSGHVMLAASATTYAGQSTYGGAAISYFDVDVIDAASSHHGDLDTRKLNGVVGGVGRGTVRLVANANGDLVGYKWSTWSGSELFMNSAGERSILAGAYDGTKTPGSTPTPTSGISDVFSCAQYEAMLPGHLAKYTCASFLDALASNPTLFGAFGTTGTTDQRKREIAAFFANVAHETSNLSIETEASTYHYCQTGDSACPCSTESTTRYNGRGPLQLSWNYNYCAAGAALGIAGLGTNPDLVTASVSNAWRTSLWFWMASAGASYGGFGGATTAHDAMTSGATPRGFYATISVINGSQECYRGSPRTTEQMDQRASRASKYASYASASIMGTTAGTNDEAYCPANPAP